MTIETDLSDIVDLRRQVSDPPPELEPEPRGCMLTLPDKVLFEFGQWRLHENAATELRGVLGAISEFPGAELLVEGHTDSIGTLERNQVLSLRRAEVVRDWLIEEGGLSPDLITAVGHASRYPVASKTTDDGRDDPEGRARNRRVEITILGAECAG